MNNQPLISLKKIRENLFKIFYLILLIALLAFILSNEEKAKSDAQSKIQNEQLVKQN